MRPLAKLVTAAEPFMYSGRAPNSGTPLPPRSLRRGGAHFVDNRAFLSSAQSDVETIAGATTLAGADIADLGCGAGRLAIGLLEADADLNSYLGLEVQRRHVQWCARQIARRNRRFNFRHVDSSNARYNPEGLAVHRVPLPTDSVDIFFAYSVFSHMRSGDVSGYLGEASRALRPSGALVVTAFLERGVPDEEENPVDYGPMDWSGPLHCVRFSVDFFSHLAEDAGLEISRLDHGIATDGQSFVIARPKDEG